MNKQGRPRSLDPVNAIQDDVIDTLGTTVENFIKLVQGVAKDLQGKADHIYKDLIQPTDRYFEHYKATNAILQEQAEEIWQELHTARTQMLFQKENYYN